MRKGNTTVKLFGASSIGMGLVILLFLTSEQQIHRNNAFTRRYPPHPIIKQYDLDIGYNSYYIAGFDQDLLYLGNSTAPWHLLQIHLGTQDTTHIRMEPIDKELRYRSLQTKVLPPYFFVMDGTIPFILRGQTKDWKAHTWMDGHAYFTKAIPIDSDRVFIRTISANTQKSTLGLIEKNDRFQIHLDTTLLETQIDGVFDVDGMLVKSENGQKLGYVYYYRNQFIILGAGLDNLKRQRTIDTTQQAQIQVAQVNKNGKIQMQAPALIINKAADMVGDRMVIRSDRLGRNEPIDLTDNTSIFDVYDYRKGAYSFSFYTEDKKRKVREFVLRDHRLITLSDDQLSVYRTVDAYFNNTRTDVKETTGQ